MASAESPSKWKLAERVSLVIGIITGLVALAGVLVSVVSYFDSSSEASRRQAEEGMVAQLAPGRDYERLNQLIGSLPDYKVRLVSGRVLYQYEHQWETIQLLVEKSDEVISVGVYGKDPTFHSRFHLGGATITLGETLIGKALPEKPNGANVYCGAHKAGYFEAYSELPLAYGGASIVLGLSDVGAKGYDLTPACAVADLPQCVSPAVVEDNVMSTAYAKCLLKISKVGQLRNSMPVSVVIISPRRIDPDMLYPPDMAW